MNSFVSSRALEAASGESSKLDDTPVVPHRASPEESMLRKRKRKKTGPLRSIRKTGVNERSLVTSDRVLGFKHRMKHTFMSYNENTWP